MRVDWSLPPWSWPLLVAAAALLAGWAWRAYRRADPPPSRAARRWLTALRAALFGALLIALAGPVVLLAARRELPPEIAIVLDDSHSMAIADGVGGETRWDAALRLAAVADSALRAREPRARVVRLRGNGLGEPAVAGGQLADEPPVAIGTDLAGLVRGALAGAAGRPLRGVLLISDGHDTARQPALAPPPPPGAGFLAVGVGDPTGPPDLAIHDLRYPEMAYRGEEIVVEVAVARRGAGQARAESLAVRLLADGRSAARATAAAPPVGGVSTLELVVRAGAEGLLAWQLEVEPLDNERVLENNRATIAVDVRKGRARLLLLAARPGWDARFVALAARAADRLELSVAHPGPDGAVLADSGRAWTSPRDVAGWGAWDGVVALGWGGPGLAVDWVSLAAAVRAGLGLLVLPAEEARPGARVSPPPPALADLLPVELAAPVWLPGEWRVRESGAGDGHSLLAGVTRDVSGGEGLDSGRWPPLRAVLAARPRPAAQSLLAAARPGGDGEPAPLLVVGPAGEGRVTWFGGRRLWELAFWERPGAQADEWPHPGRRLLQNLLQWTATGEGSEGLGLAGHRRLYQEGERIRLEARWRDARGIPAAPGRPLVLRLREAGGKPGQARSFALAPLPGDSSRAAVLLPPLPAGRWLARPEAGGSPPVSGPEEEFLVVPQSLEAAQARQEPRRLRALAAAAGGAYLDASAPAARERLTAALEAWPLVGESVPRRSRWDAAAGWPLLLVIIALAGAEWVLRRFQGLP